MINIDNCIIRKLDETDYAKYMVMINEFRETFFTKDNFIETLNYIQPFSEIWVMEYDNDIIPVGKYFVK